MTSNLINLQKRFGKNLILKENLSKYSWFNLGGPAEIFFRPDSLNQLQKFLIEIKNENLKIYILGAGSNTLIRDSGVKGVVIKLSSNFSETKLLDNNTIEVGAAALDRKAADFAKDNSISGLEFLACIPGTIGGAVIMNSGCYGSDMSKILKSVKVIDENGDIKDIRNDNIEFFYRRTSLSEKYIILSAVLKGQVSEKKNIEKIQSELIERKKISQPSRVKTGGSTFKNFDDQKAWTLIKESGCDKLSVGDAKISEKHCNFLVNNGKAKSKDIETLIIKIKKKVQAATGVNLELEIKIIGE